MALTHRIVDSKRTIGLALVAMAWLFLPTSSVQACNHPSIVSFAPPEVGENTTKPATPIVQRPMKRAATPHNPFDPLGPCQSPQCDGTPDRPDRPLTSSSTTKVRDTWSLAWSEITVAARPPMSGAWLQRDALNPLQPRDPIFHPPRPHGH